MRPPLKLYTMCAMLVFLASDIMWEVVNLNRPGYEIQQVELNYDNLCRQSSVSETKTTVNGIKLMSGELAAEAMQHRFFHATYLVIILWFMYETKPKCILMKLIVRWNYNMQLITCLLSCVHILLLPLKRGWRTSLRNENLQMMIGLLQGELFVQTLQPGKFAEF